MTIGCDGLEDVELGHEAGVEADEVDAFDAGLLLGGAKGGVELGEADALFVAAVVECDACPRGAVVPEDEGVVLGGVGADAPGDEVGEGLGVAHVEFAEVVEFLGVDVLGVVVTCDEVAFGGVPVAVGCVVVGSTLVDAVNLDDDVEVVVGANLFHFVEVADCVGFEVVVTVEVDEDGPVGSANDGGAGGAGGDAVVGGAWCVAGGSW